MANYSLYLNTWTVHQEMYPIATMGLLQVMDCDTIGVALNDCVCSGYCTTDRGSVCVCVCVCVRARVRAYVCGVYIVVAVLQLAIITACMTLWYNIIMNVLLYTYKKGGGGKM